MIAATEPELKQFIYREARWLDERRFTDWLGLFCDDGIYWVPTQPRQASPLAAVSLIYEPKALLAVRVARLSEPTLHADSPPARTHHHVTAIEIEQDGAETLLRSSLIVAESRGNASRWFAGRVLHRVRVCEGKLRIVLKRVDLIDSDAPHRALIVPF